eukprot:4566347-Pyramimonas_sp.AAC.1
MSRVAIGACAPLPSPGRSPRRKQSFRTARRPPTPRRSTLSTGLRCTGRSTSQTSKKKLIALSFD